MFTGIVDRLGRWAGLRNNLLSLDLEPGEGYDDLRVGESVAVNGACLSLERRERERLFFSVSQETLQRTVLGELIPGALLNLERALRLGDRLSGHMVQGHVDGVAVTTRVEPRGDFARLTFSVPTEAVPYIVLKGSITLNGVSLTVSRLQGASLSVEVIPLTLRQTNLHRLKIGGRVNLETDLVGKYLRSWYNKG